MAGVIGKALNQGVDVLAGALSFVKLILWK